MSQELGRGISVACSGANIGEIKGSRGLHYESRRRAGIATILGIRHQTSSFLPKTNLHLFRRPQLEEGRRSRWPCELLALYINKKDIQLFWAIDFMCFFFKSSPWPFGFHFEAIGTITQLVYCLLGFITNFYHTSMHAQYGSMAPDDSFSNCVVHFYN